jgi:hypothetical protein
VHALITKALQCLEPIGVLTVDGFDVREPTQTVDLHA